jgi:hypothetical protein
MRAAPASNNGVSDMRRFARAVVRLLTGSVGGLLVASPSFAQVQLPPINLGQGAPKATPEEKFGTLFAGKKQQWRKPSERLIAQVREFGQDVDAKAGGTYINFLRAGEKFAILQPSAAERLDLGIKLKEVAPKGRFEPAGSWNAMVTHRGKIEDPNQLDREVVTWLKQAYDAAK